MADGVEVVVGTYEQFLIGYKIKNTNGDLELTHSFATQAHTGSIKCVTCSGDMLASGGADDKIVIHDMKTRTESRVLMHHNGTVNSIAFTENNSHIFSVGSDGAFYALRTGSWQPEQYWPKAHKGLPITYLSIHPSNKLALTIGKDHTLKTWNLIKGREAYATNLKSKGAANALSVVWSPEGGQFSITGGNDVSVWSLSNATIERVLKCPSKAHCMVWISESLAAIGLESGEIVIFNLEDEKKYTFKGHNQRVKAIAYGNKYLFTASSFGDIKIWRFNAKKMKLTEKACANTDCRITCLTLVLPLEVKKETPEDEAEVEEVNDDVEVICPPEKEIKIHSGLRPYVTVTVDGEENKVKSVKPKKKFFKNKIKKPKRKFKKTKKA